MISVEAEESLPFLAKVDDLLDQRLFEQAKNLAEERLRRLPDDVDGRIAMCKLWTRLGRLEQVEEILKGVEERIADWSRLHANMGDICLESGLLKEATRFYRRFLILNPRGELNRSVSNKLERLMGAGEEILTTTDEDHYEDITDIDTDFHTMTLAELYLRQNQWEMACNVLKEIIRREPDHPEALARLQELENLLPARVSERHRQARDRVSRELSRWLRNIGRMRVYAT